MICVKLQIVLFRYCRNVFEKDYKATIGVDFESEQYVFFNRSFILQL